LGILNAPAGEAPTLSAKRAVEIAEQALAEKGAGSQVHIQSLVLQETTRVGGKTSWTVTWSTPLPASNRNKNEVGIEIGMDGSVVHLIKSPGEMEVKRATR
jgi:hypothetical protein